jgi:superoxide dismutase, Fe-Mn family
MMEQISHTIVRVVPSHGERTMHTLPPLPYAKDALAPHISAETMDFHYAKHHAGYVKKLNELVADTPMADLELEQLITKTHDAQGGQEKKIFNNAAQCWNHEFFWNSMTPDNFGKPSGELMAMIGSDFGDVEGFNDAFIKAAEGHFGSGWVWLVETGGKVEVVTTVNADLPMTSGKTALLVCDIWEHAYYLDYQNRKPDFVKTYLKNLINWEFAEANLQAMADA